MKSLIFLPWKAQAIHESNIEWQTRRLGGLKVINQSPDAWCISGQVGAEWGFGNLHCEDDIIIKCPFSVGDEVYIKEKYYRLGCWRMNGFTKTGRPHWVFIRLTNDILFEDSPPATVCHGRSEPGWYKRPSLFLPADLARTVVTITDIRAQRVQDISEKDAIAEGLVYNAFWDMWESPLHPGSLIDWYKTAFKQLWDSIHGEGSWERNDWVWKYSFIRRDYETTESHRDTSSY